MKAYEDINQRIIPDSLSFLFKMSPSKKSDKCIPPPPFFFPPTLFTEYLNGKKERQIFNETFTSPNGV